VRRLPTPAEISTGSSIVLTERDRQTWTTIRS
jgi:hypothetical protein